MNNIHIEALGRSRYRLKTEITLPKPRHEVFQFFSDAGNLEKLTPSYVNFRILTPLPIAMHEGALIDYKIRLHGIPIRWRTKITTWNPDEGFIDEQIRGPYRVWHHEHQFEDLGAETRMHDIVDYRLWFGPILHPLMVKRDVTRIFQYRQAKIVELFSGE